MEYSPTIRAQQRESLRDMLNNQKYSDVTFIVGTKRTEYHLNRVFLASISCVFEAMLFGRMEENKLNANVIIEDVDPRIFECIINYAYCNDPQVTIANVLPLAKVCDKYQIRKLSASCYTYFTSCLESNFCALFNQCVKLNMQSIVTQCLQFIQKCDAETVQKMLNVNEFKMMSLKAIRSFLQLDKLSMDEASLWKLISTWADHHSRLNNHSEDDVKQDIVDNDKRAEYRIYLLKSVKDLVRWGAMSGEYFVDNIAHENIFTKDELISILLYFQKQELGCGSFNAVSRTPIQSLKYALKMSSQLKSSMCRNSYEALTDRNLSIGCGTMKQQNPWIQADFEGIMHISKIEIGALGSRNGWGAAYLNRAELKTYDNKKADWVVASEIKGLQAGVIESIDVDIRTDSIRLCKTGSDNYLGIGYLKCTGSRM
eukprot:162724_1